MNIVLLASHGFDEGTLVVCHEVPDASACQHETDEVDLRELDTGQDHDDDLSGEVEQF